MNASKIPSIDSIQELAQFWDTHDLTDFDGELEEVPAPVFTRDTSILVQLPPEEAEAVRRMAVSNGVSDSELIRKWVLERVSAD